MGQFEDLDLFTKVVEAGSISKAAKALNIAKSAVSRRLALLEERFEATLIERRPGYWAITQRGQLLFERARPLLAEADALGEDFAKSRLAQAGPLHLSLPRDFGLDFLAAPLREFAASHPEIRLHLSFDDRLVDLNNENFDAAIRITSRPPQDVQAEYLGQTKAYLVASPAYLAKAPTLTEPADLAAHRILGYGMAPSISLTLGGKVYEFKVSYASNAGLNLRDAAVNGLGLAMLPDFLCHQARQNGDLVPILPEYPLPSLQITLCRPAQARPSLRLRRFTQYLLDVFQAS